MFSLGQRIRELRMKKGLTQIDLAKGLCTPSMISQIESDRARPSYKILFAIGERLDVALEKLLADVDLNLEYVSTYKMARAMVAAKEYASAIPLLKELLGIPRGTIPTFDIMFELAECYLHTNQLEEAEKQLAEVQELATLRQDYQMLALVYKSYGLIEFNRKNYQLASYQWQKALEEVEKMVDVDVYLQASILFNLGLVHSKSGQIFEALEFYSHASTIYEGLDSLYDIGTAYMGIGMSYKRLNELDKAAEYSEQARAIFRGLDNVVMAVKLQVTCAVLYGETGREEEAVSLLENSIAKFRELAMREDEGMAYVELAKVRLKLEDVTVAEEACQRARLLLPELHLYQAFLNRVLGGIALTRGHREEAIRRYQMAAEIFKRMGETGEWDAMQYEVARLYVEEQDFTRAYSIMEDIRHYSRQTLEERGIVL